MEDVNCTQKLYTITFSDYDEKVSESYIALSLAIDNYNKAVLENKEILYKIYMKHHNLYQDMVNTYNIAMTCANNDCSNR